MNNKIIESENNNTDIKELSFKSIKEYAEKHPALFAEMFSVTLLFLSLYCRTVYNLYNTGYYNYFNINFSTLPSTSHENMLFPIIMFLGLGSVILSINLLGCIVYNTGKGIISKTLRYSFFLISISIFIIFIIYYLLILQSDILWNENTKYQFYTFTITTVILINLISLSYVMTEILLIVWKFFRKIVHLIYLSVRKIIIIKLFIDTIIKMYNHIKVKFHKNSVINWIKDKYNKQTLNYDNSKSKSKNTFFIVQSCITIILAVCVATLFYSTGNTSARTLSTIKLVNTNQLSETINLNNIQIECDNYAVIFENEQSVVLSPCKEFNNYNQSELKIYSCYHVNIDKNNIVFKTATFNRIISVPVQQSKPQ